MSNEDDLLTSLRALQGSHGTPQLARDPVNLPAIRNWCDAIGINNPRYTDPGGAVAPVAMLSSWAMSGSVPAPEDPACPRGKALSLLRQQGFSGVIGTTFEEEYLRPLRAGERLSSTLFLTAVSEPKKTGLGEGYFVTTRTDYANEAGEQVGSWTLRLLAFKPRARTEGAEKSTTKADVKTESKPVPTPEIKTVASVPERHQTMRRFDEINVGDELTPWTIPVTPLLVIAGAVATRDFSDIHIDVAGAKRAGLPNIIMNSMTSSALCSRYAEDWAGPVIVQKNVRLRLGAPCVVGDTLTITATVAAKEAKGTYGLVTLNVAGRVSSGDHLGGTLDLELPL